MAIFKKLSTWIFLTGIIVSYYVGQYVPPTLTVEKITLDTKIDRTGKEYFIYREEPKYLVSLKSIEESQLRPEALAELAKKNQLPLVTEDFVYEGREIDGETKKIYYQLIAKQHWGFWSLLPALIAILLCWQTKEPITSLFAGIVSGALLLGRFDLTDEVLLPSIGTESAAGILILYLWLLGGLLGIWSKTGAAHAFADLMTRRFVKGPKSAKLVSWFLGVIFFQGGTMSTVLVGTTVKPLADKQKISHEELSYIVDSTASPIASQLAFNAWPGYIQAFIFVAGVSWLATEADRITFFFKSVPFCFYAIFAVMGTFLLSIEKAPFVGKQMQEAIKRARSTGELDADDAKPLSAKELHKGSVPEGYKPNVLEFFIPLGLIIFISIGTFIIDGSPQIRWAFGAAVVVALFSALIRGMKLTTVMSGFVDGLKGVVGGSVILLLAIVIGLISKEAGGGTYLVELLGQQTPYWILPVMLQLMTMIIAFSTGTSWGTYAIAFPLAMPLSWAIANSQGLAHPEFFMTLCFAAVMDGSVYGDQCSPISDTTVLSSMSTGCDLMDHVKTQIPQATIAAALAAIMWTLVTIVFAS
ncbi:MAG: sodium:proton antiporter [Ignavibacteria bacterium]|nr:sodium:proton antiporter [Ignavibacteria bacterium]